VTTHHEDLLQQATNANKLGGSLISIRQGLKDLDLSADKFGFSYPCLWERHSPYRRLKAKIHTPYESLQVHISRLDALHQASDVLRRASRFVALARRLQVQMNEMNDKVDGEDKSIIQMDSQSAPVQAQNTDAGDEKERAIAKAALSIAELGVLHLSHSHVYHNSGNSSLPA